MAAVDDAVEHVAHGRAGRGRDDIDARHHHFADRLFAKFDDAGDHVALIFFQVGIALDQVPQPILGVGRRESALHSQERAQAAIQRAEWQQDKKQHPVQDFHRPHERQCHLLRSRQRQDATQELHQQQHHDLEHSQ